MQHVVEDGHLKIIIEQDLVAANAPKKLEDIRAIMDQAAPLTDICLDISGVEVLDSLGVNLLVGIYKHCSVNKWGFKVTGASPSILRLLSLYKLNSYFGIDG
ncbi:MAG: anti-sigma factor antagonist [Spartobacteria bacterium]|nr:anti-sigma factor antagonist [Spartobacteria bacterium]